MASAAPEYFDLDLSGAVPVARMAVDVIRHPGQAQDLGRELNAAIDSGAFKDLVLNLRETHYLGSTAFAVLFGVAKKIGAAGGRFALCELHPDVLTGANILGLGSLVPIYDHERDAVASF